MAHQQWHGNKREQLRRSRNVPVSPREIAAPHGEGGIEADIREQESADRDQISSNFGPKPPPRDHAENHSQYQQWIEQKDGLFRCEQRAEESHVEWSFEWIRRRQRRVQHFLFAGKYAHVS